MEEGDYYDIYVPEWHQHQVQVVLWLEVGRWNANETTVGKPNYDFLGQVTYNTSDGADWSKGAIMFDFPSFRPTIGDHKRFNEQFCKWPGAERSRAEQSRLIS